MFELAASSVEREDGNPDVVVVAKSDEADDPVVDILKKEVVRGKKTA